MDRVHRWMTSPAIAAPETLTLPHARELMHQHQIRRLPVVNAAGALVGMVTEGDINRLSDSPENDVRQFNLYHSVRTVPLRDFMSRSVVTVAQDAPLMLVANLLRTYKIGGLPVVDGERLIGVISESDLFRAMEAAGNEELTTTSANPHQPPASDQ